VQQSAGDSGIENVCRFFVDQFMQAASAAAIAQRFPFGIGQLAECFPFPKRYFRHAAL
jgi:hypothetical protein